MTVNVDASRCIGCGMCAAAVPAVFQIIGGMLDALAADKQRRADAAARGDFRVNLD